MIDPQRRTAMLHESPLSLKPKEFDLLLYLVRHAGIVLTRDALLREVWGVSPGSVTPFGAINDSDGRVTVVLDVPMMEHELLNYHPLVNTMTTALARDDLVRFLDWTGHPPRIERVSGLLPEAD